MVRWDTETQLTAKEEKIKERYAKAIVKSIFARCADPTKLALLLQEASDLALKVYWQATSIDF